LFCKTKKKFKATTNSKHDKPIAPNRLNRVLDDNKLDRLATISLAGFGKLQAYLII